MYNRSTILMEHIMYRENPMNNEIGYFTASLENNSHVRFFRLERGRCGMRFVLYRVFRDRNGEDTLMTDHVWAWWERPDLQEYFAGVTR